MGEPALTRERILRAAEDVLRRFGPEKATVVYVARALGGDARQRLPPLRQQGRPARRRRPPMAGNDDARPRRRGGRARPGAVAAATVARPPHRREAEACGRRSGALRHVLLPGGPGAGGRFGATSMRSWVRPPGSSPTAWPAASSPRPTPWRPEGRSCTRPRGSTARPTRPSGRIPPSTRPSTRSGASSHPAWRRAGSRKVPEPGHGQDGSDQEELIFIFGQQDQRSNDPGGSLCARRKAGGHHRREFGIGLETARLAWPRARPSPSPGVPRRLRRAAESLDSRTRTPRRRPIGSPLRHRRHETVDPGAIRRRAPGRSPVPAGRRTPSGGRRRADIRPGRAAVDSGGPPPRRGARRPTGGPKMEGGSITLMSGLYSTRPAAGGAMAAAAVAGVEGMTRALALDLAPIRVNAVAPGLIDTPLWDAFGPQREAILARAASCPSGASAGRRRWPRRSFPDDQRVRYRDRPADRRRRRSRLTAPPLHRGRRRGKKGAGEIPTSLSVPLPVFRRESIRSARRIRPGFNHGIARITRINRTGPPDPSRLPSCDPCDPWSRTGSVGSAG